MNGSRKKKKKFLKIEKCNTHRKFLEIHNARSVVKDSEVKKKKNLSDVISSAVIKINFNP